MGEKKVVRNHFQPGVPSPLAERGRMPAGLHIKKGLGQHFLVDESVLQNIVASADLSPSDVVVEVGPGLGILTKELAKQVSQVVAIELDARLISFLNQTLLPFSNVNLIKANILQIDLEGLTEGWGGGYKVVANLPYYIASPILHRFLEAGRKPRLLVVMLQKEVGEAIVAEPGQMSLLSVGVQLYGKPTIVGRVVARSFYPPPKVDSVILRIEPYPRPAVEVEVATFFEVVRAGLSSPRKQLHNSLAQGLKMPPREAAHLLKEAGIDPQRRAETLSLKEWARLWAVSTPRREE